MTFGAIEFLIEGNPNAEMADFAPAVTTGLVDIRFPKLDSEKTLYNWADAESEGLIIGTPVFNPGSVLFKSETNYLQSLNPETINRTIIAVARTPDAATNGTNSGTIAGNLANNNSGFYFGFANNGGSPSIQARRYGNNNGVITLGGTAAINIAAANLNVWKVYALVMQQVNNAFTIQVRNLTDNLTSNLVTTTTNIPVLAGNLEYGSGANTGLVEIAALFDYNVALSAQQLTDSYNQIKLYMSEESPAIIV